MINFQEMIQIFGVADKKGLLFRPTFKFRVKSRLIGKIHREDCTEAKGGVKEVNLNELVSKLHRWCECMEQLCSYKNYKFVELKTIAYLTQKVTSSRISQRAQPVTFEEKLEALKEMRLLLQGVGDDDHLTALSLYQPQSLENLTLSDVVNLWMKSAQLAESLAYEDFDRVTTLVSRGDQTAGYTLTRQAPSGFSSFMSDSYLSRENEIEALKRYRDDSVDRALIMGLIKALERRNVLSFNETSWHALPSSIIGRLLELGWRGDKSSFTIAEIPPEEKIKEWLQYTQLHSEEDHSERSAFERGYITLKSLD